MILVGDCEEVLASCDDSTIDCVVTSPPYWQPDFKRTDTEVLGLEPTLDAYCEAICTCFRGVHHVLKERGMMFVILGGACSVPWHVALSLRADGWWLQRDIVWQRPPRLNRPHEYIFLFTPHEQMIDLPAYRKRHDLVETIPSVWAFDETEDVTINLDAFQTLPDELLEQCIAYGSCRGDTILDPFAGAGTTGRMAHLMGRNFLGIEINPLYASLAEQNLQIKQWYQ